MINIRVTRPKATLRKKSDSEEVVEVEEPSIFTLQNLVLLGVGIAVGVILKQQGEINSLRNTVLYLQEVIR